MLDSTEHAISTGLTEYQKIDSASPSDKIPATDPHLACLIKTWSSLPDAIKRAILALTDLDLLARTPAPEAQVCGAFGTFPTTEKAKPVHPCTRLEPKSPNEKGDFNAQSES